MTDISKTFADLTEKLSALGRKIIEFGKRVRQLLTEQGLADAIDRYDEWYDGVMDKTEERLREWLYARYAVRNMYPTDRNR